MLNIENLQFSFPESKSSENTNTRLNMEFNLKVNAGEILSVIGPSGSGKTTLLNLIAGFVQPSSGRVLLDDNDISKLAIAKRPVTTVFQENNLFPHLDVFTNVAIGIQPSLKLDNDQKQEVNAALENVGLGDLMKRLPKALSGGQRQRVALARALVRKHSVLLLDEPLAALGPAMREEIIELLKQLVKKENMHALLISHQPEDALKASDRTAFINQGKVLKIDNSNDLLEHSDLTQIKDYLGNSKNL